MHWCGRTNAPRPNEQRQRRRQSRRRTSTLAPARDVLLWGSTMRRRSMLPTKTYTFSRDEIVNLVRFEQGHDPVFSTKLVVHRRLRAGSPRLRTPCCARRSRPVDICTP